MIVLLVTTTLLEELDLGVGVAEVDDELETGITVDEVLPGATVDDETITFVVVDETVTFAMVVADEAAAAMQEHTLAAELRAARAVSNPQALVAHGSAVTTIARDIDDTHCS